MMMMGCSRRASKTGVPAGGLDKTCRPNDVIRRTLCKSHEVGLKMNILTRGQKRVSSSGSNLGYQADTDIINGCLPPAMMKMMAIYPGYKTSDITTNLDK